MTGARRFGVWVASFSLVLAPLAACRRAETAAPASAKTTTLLLGAYTTPREAYRDAILPAFERHWKEKTGGGVEFRTSYQGSGAQARAIIGGFEADVAALSLAPDIDKIVSEKLITHDWKAVGAHGGMVTASAVVIAVRKGNPKNIRDWSDLRRADVSVLTPNVRTSGGAMWNVAAIWGASLRGKTPAAANDPAAAQGFLGEILARVRIMDRSGRDSMLTFERGVGDAAITYENEVLLGRAQGRDYEYVVPSSTLRTPRPPWKKRSCASSRKSRPSTCSAAATTGTSRASCRLAARTAAARPPRGRLLFPRSAHPFL